MNDKLKAMSFADLMAIRAFCQKEVEYWRESVTDNSADSLEEIEERKTELQKWLYSIDVVDDEVNARLFALF